jgi:hypothetical protein
VPGDVAFDQMLRFLSANAGLVAAFGIALVLFALVAIVLSLIAQGGMARATSDLAQGQTISLGAAWHAGLQLFWRYAGLWLLLGLVALAVAIVVAALVGIVAALGTQSAGAAVGAGLVLGLPALILGVAVAVVLAIVVPYAQRAIVVEDVGPISALRSGWHLLRANLGPSLLLWLLQVGLGLGAGLAVMVVFVPLVIVMGIVGVGIWALTGPGALLIAFGAIAALTLLAALLVLAAIANTFFWHYWTQGYVRLRPRPPTAPAVVAAA